MSSDTSRKVKKNPLLSAAGFGFESFAENAVLMPVTPATPAVLQDEGEINSFIGQEPPVSLPQQFPHPEASSVQHLSSEINFPSIGELQDPTPQPQKQGYFSSILSSLPNLSLSSIKGETSPDGSQNQNQKPRDVTSPSFYTQEPSPYSYVQDNNSYGIPPSTTTFVAPNLYNPAAHIPSGVTQINPGTPPQIPVALPPTTGGSASYRLGNQRRLKYAPPPELTSTAPKHYPAPNLQPGFPQQNLSSPPSFFNPNSPPQLFAGPSFSPSAPPISGNPSPAQGTSQQGSIRSSPVPVAVINAPSLKSLPHSTTEIISRGTQITSSQGPPANFNPSLGHHINSQVSSTSSFASSVPQRIPSKPSEPNLLPFTPQNTPANAASSGLSFPTQSWTPASSSANGEAAAASSRDQKTFPDVITPSEKNLPAASFFQPQLYSAPQKSIGTTFEVLQPVNLAPEVLADNIIEPSSNPEEAIDETTTELLSQTLPTFTPSLFTPISAAKVSEKLEHLLAEQEEKFAPERSSDPELTDAAQEIRSLKPANSDRQGETQFTKDSPNGEKESVQDVPLVNLGALDEVDLTKSETLSDVSLKEAETAVKEEPGVSIGQTDFNRPSLNSSLNYSAVPSTVSSEIADPFPQNHQQRPVEASQNNAATGFFPANQSEHRTASNYFSPAVGLNAPSFYNPAEYLRQIPSSHPPPIPPPPLNTTGYPDPNQSRPIIGSSAPTYPTVPNPFGRDTSNSSGIPNPVYESPAENIPTFYNPAQFQTNLQQSFGNRNLQASSYYRSQANDQVSFLNSRPKGEDNIGPSGFFSSSSNEAAGYFAPPTPPMATVVPEATGSATLSPVQMSANPLGGHATPETLPPSLQKLAAGTSERTMEYRPVYQHWFYRKEVETKVLWHPFSMQDSLNLEEVHNSTEITPETTVATDGGRYDVDILRRRRTPVYWSGSPSEVRRCSWFYKGPTESRYVPYEEGTAARLEEEYKQACLADNWNRKIELSNGEHIIFHSSTVQVHYLQAGTPDLTTSWGNGAASEDSTYLQGAVTRPRVVKRGVDEFNIDEGEPDRVDHLLFLVHGIGSVCDLKFRSVEEVVDEFRSISLQLVQSHYRTASEQSVVNRIEVLPISWHATLHSEDTGIDKKLQAITLESIPKLRHFTNDTLLDILFYTSPIYCQTIMQTVGKEMNRLYSLFKERNPSFGGGVYLGGHSLGSLILFDLLCHQKPPKEEVPEEKEDGEGSAEPGNEDTVPPIAAMKPAILKRRLSRKISYVMGNAGTGQPFIDYPQLNFHPNAFFALGSPIGMFVTVRGIDTLGEDFALPTCPSFFNIFHPFDPVAYRMEALIDPEAPKHRPMLIPHHKGRKRMHLELKETMARVGADIKQKVLDSMRSTWNSVYQLAMFHKPDNQELEREIDKVVEEQLHNPPCVTEQQNDESGADIKIGKLNGGRRVDYVLQEAPFEYINEYIFALTSHVCYWESEDTMLMILKEIYGSMGIQTDAQLPQQTLTIERATPSPVMPRANHASASGSSTGPPEAQGSGGPVLGMDPTAPISEKTIGPPPTTGFVRKT